MFPSGGLARSLDVFLLAALARSSFMFLSLIVAHSAILFLSAHMIRSRSMLLSLSDNSLLVCVSIQRHDSLSISP